MTGLQQEIESRKKGKLAGRYEKFSSKFIANTLLITYAGARRKVIENAFNVEEAITVFNAIAPADKQNDFRYFAYLFNEIENYKEV